MVLHTPNHKQSIPSPQDHADNDNDNDDADGDDDDAEDGDRGQLPPVSRSRQYQSWCRAV